MITIEKTSESRLQELDLNKLPFGKVFSDHMLVCKFDGKKWENPVIKPYGPMEVSPGMQVFHYGQAIFEGMKAFRTEDNRVLLFRPERNYLRFNKSAERMCMPDITEEIFIDGLKELMHTDLKWVPNDEGSSLYIRPFMVSSGELISAQPAQEFTFMIISAPALAYYRGIIKVKVEEQYSRSAAGGTGFAKAAGNYAGAFYPTKLAQEEGYTQLIWTDAATHSFVEESGTMNILFRIGDKLVTPPTSERILDGITRDSLITLAKDMGIEVEERRVYISEIMEAAKNGELKEAFGAGTAVTVGQIGEIGFRGERTTIPTPEDGYAIKLKKALQDIQYGRAEDKFGWTVEVK